MIVAAPRRRAATTATATEHRPPTRRKTATTAAATKHCPPSNFNWDIIGMATATEHNQIADGQLVTDAEHNHWTRNVTFSIGSIKIRTDVSNAHTRRVLLVLEQEVHSRIHNEISEDELVQISCATEQRHSRIPDRHYQKKSWSGTIEAISRSVAVYHQAAENSEDSARLEILDRLRKHILALRGKCVENPRCQPRIIHLISDYIWNRSCNVAMHMLLDAILTSHIVTATEHSCNFAALLQSIGASQPECECVFNILEACLDRLKTRGEEIIDELTSYHRAVKQHTDTQPQ